jgi:hypothetical protein
VSELKEQLPNWINEGENDLPNDSGSQWGFVKHKIWEFSRNYGAKVKKAKILIKLQLEKDLKEIHENLNETNKQQYAELQDQLNDIIENEVKGSILRSLCKEYESGEKCSKYFFSLEKYRGKQKTISRIKLADGSFTSEPKLILNECRSFYQKLYSANAQVDPDAFPFFFQTRTHQYLNFPRNKKSSVILILQRRNYSKLKKTLEKIKAQEWTVSQQNFILFFGIK